MKLTMYPASLNGNCIERNQFGYVLREGCGFDPQGVDAIHFWCPGGKKRICAVDLTLGAQEEADAHGRRRWHWDGNMHAPTLSPSITCRCGWHGHIVAGGVQP